MDHLYQEPSPTRLVEGIVVKAPTSLVDKVSVVIPSFNDGHVYGPTSWVGRGSLLPRKGARCLVALDEHMNAWILSWEGAGEESDLVSVLPASPYDGQVVAFQNAAMAALGIVWRLRYRAASASAYKWEFDGGSDFYQFTDPAAEVVHTESFGTSVAVSGAPTFTTPLAGDWKVDVAAYGVFITDGFIERVVGGTATQATSGNVAGVVLGTTAGHVTEGGMTNPGRLLGVASGAVLGVRSLGSIGKVRLYGTTLIVRPIRVG